MSKEGKLGKDFKLKLLKTKNVRTVEIDNDKKKKYTSNIENVHKNRGMEERNFEAEMNQLEEEIVSLDAIKRSYYEQLKY